MKKTPGQRIKEERLALGWSQQKLADEITRIKGEKISRAAVAQWEGGASKTQKPENFFAAAMALGLAPQWVLNESVDKHPPKSVSIITRQNSVSVFTPAPPAIPVLKPLTERDKWIADLVGIAEQLDTLHLAMLIGKARDFLAEQPAKQTPASSS